MQLDTDSGRADEIDDTVITVASPEELTAVISKEKVKTQNLMLVIKVDILRDSLDGNILEASNGFESDLARQVENGALPQQMICMVETTGELIDVEFDSEQARCYYNPVTKEYFKPV